MEGQLFKIITDSSEDMYVVIYYRVISPIRGGNWIDVAKVRHEVKTIKDDETIDCATIDTEKTPDYRNPDGTINKQYIYKGRVGKERSLNLALNDKPFIKININHHPYHYKLIPASF
jgi:hypothetical protein